jgi:hypothetical protein
MTWESFLRFVSGEGIATVAGILLSLALQHVPRLAYWYDPLDPKDKRLVYVALCFVVPVLGATLLGLGGYEPWSWDPLIWRALVGGAAAAGIGTLTATRLLSSAEDAALYREWLTTRAQGR